MRPRSVIFALDLGGLVGGVVENLAIHVAEDVVADPAEHFEITGGEHRCQHTLEERFASLAVLAGVASFAELRELANCRN